MRTAKKTKHKVEYGDFQTPLPLAREVCSLLSQSGCKPLSVLEPTCGAGNFLRAALEQFSGIKQAAGVEINDEYVASARRSIPDVVNGAQVRILKENFFTAHWNDILGSLPDPLLIIGNPPWVTNAELGSLGSTNLPFKSNFQKQSGIDAITGKSNFDISEWMLIRALEWIRGRQAMLAMLCKTAVARKALFHAWSAGQPLQTSDIYQIDAMKSFGAAVDACLFVVKSSSSARSLDCRIHESLAENGLGAVFGYRNGQLVANVQAFERWAHLEGEERYKWRSGIKHDCSKVMEVREENGRYRNGLGELVELEAEYVYPMLKSADICREGRPRSRRWMLVTHRFVGEDTSRIRNKAPKTWEYLVRHGALLDGRASAIYRKRPRFSIFGVGDYSFALWKVAISGLYKRLEFKMVGPSQGKPVVLDDTCYFIAGPTKEEAQLLVELLNSEPARQFFSAVIFWDAKRPITVAVLRRLDLLAVAKELNLERPLEKYLQLSAESCIAPPQMSTGLFS
jgi:hypothetical protein